MKKRVFTLAALASVAAFLASAPAIAEPAEITERRAEAELVLAQIEQIDGELGLAIEAYNSASVRLDEVEGEIEVNQRHLQIARRSYRAAQDNLADRIVALYTSGEEDVIEVLLGSASLDDLLDRIDSVRRISEQDVRIIAAVRDARADIKKRAARLAKARREAERIVSRRTAQRQAIEEKLAERERLYSSIETEITQLVAEEQERQRRLREEARRRLQEERRLAAVAVDAAAAVPAGAAVPVPGTGAIAPPPSASYGSDVVSIAMQYLGIPYVWGGASPSGFDCSGLVVYVFAQAGRGGLPHYTGSLWQLGSAVPREALAAGDLVFFNGLGHMGIYIGGGQFIHSPHTGDVVKISSLSDSWYAATYVGARRL